MAAETPLPLEGILVLDLSRMLPGAVLARQLVDLGARLIKVEEPVTGDPMRMVPPQVGGMGVGFAALLRGAESVALDLRAGAGADFVRRLAGRADVLVESFRPGTLEGWGLGWDELSAQNARLVWCSLPSFGTAPGVRDRVAHDLNLSAMAGVLERVGGGVPGLQLADVTSGLLAATAVTAALLARQRDGRGRRIEQPLAAGPLPFLTWVWAEHAAGGGGIVDTLLGGACPCYRTYRCGDGCAISLAALEPKFWAGFVELIGAPELGGDAFALGAEAQRVAAAVESRLAAHSREHWVAAAAAAGLPVGPVHGLADAVAEPAFAAAGLLEELPLPGGDRARSVGPWAPGLGATPDRPAPRLGEHTDAILAEFGIRT